MPTIRDVAKASGVSPATVSYVLNNGPRSVSPPTRERVLRTMQEMNYHPSAVARGLTRKRMNAIGVVFPNEFPTFVANPYVGRLLDGILAEMMRRHQNATLFTGQLLSDEHQNLSVFFDGRCDGLLLIAPPENSPVIPLLLKKRVPFLLIGTKMDDPHVSYVDVDNVAMAYRLVAYLVAQGHNRIAHLGGENGIQSADLRRRGYKDALAAAGIPYRRSYVPEGAYRQISGYERALAMADLPRKSRPTAIFCGSDEIALGALNALKERGVSVPGEISLVGFDDIEAASICDPPLTTVHQPLQSMGESAVSEILRLIENPDSTACKKLVCSEIVIRNSVAPPPLS